MSVVITHCHCGAGFKVAASVVGRKVRCKKCGDAFEVRGDKSGEQIHSQPNPRGSRHGSSTETPAAQNRPVDTAPPAALPESPPAPTLGYATLPDESMRLGQGLRPFFQALLSAFLSPLRLPNIKTFLIAWAVLATGLIGSSYLFEWGSVRLALLGLLVLALSEGAFAAFSFGTILQAAEGEKELPAFPLMIEFVEWWRMLIMPFFAFIGTGFLALIPTIVYLFAILSTTPATGVDAALRLLSLAGVTMFGMFFWPMIVLTVAMGGARALLRIGRMNETAIRTFVPYCCTVLLVYCSGAMALIVTFYLNQDGVSGLVVTVIGLGARTFMQTVAMRGIGVYYYHFRARFEWLTD